MFSARATLLAEQLAAPLSPHAQECAESAADAEEGAGNALAVGTCLRMAPQDCEGVLSEVNDLYLGRELAMAALPAVAPAWWAQGRAPQTARGHEPRQQLCTATGTREAC